MDEAGLSSMREIFETIKAQRPQEGCEDSVTVAELGKYTTVYYTNYINCTIL